MPFSSRENMFRERQATDRQQVGNRVVALCIARYLSGDEGYLRVDEAIAVHSRVDHLLGGLALILCNFHLEKSCDVWGGRQVDLNLMNSAGEWCTVGQEVMAEYH